MEQITTVTQKGQVTIPKKIRDDLRVKKYSKVIVEKEKNYIKITPVKDFLDFAGVFKTKKKRSVLKARDFFEKNYKRF